MEESLSGFGSSLQSMGGGLAVTFIIAIAAGIVAMTLVYVGSALLVLDRFARVSKGWLAPVLSGGVVALCLSVLSTVAQIPADSVFTWDQWRETLVRHFGQTLILSAVFLSIVSLAVRNLSQLNVARIGTFLTALGVGLGLSATGSPSVVPSTFAVTVGLGVTIWAYRSLRKAGEASTIEWLFRVAALGLAPGAALALIAAGSQTVAPEVSVLLIAVLFGSVTLGLIPLAISGFIQMRKSVEWFIAIRYLVARRRQIFISAISAICVSGIAAGVWLIIVVLSVMNGFEQTWRDEILGNRAHFTVHNSFGPFVDHEEILKQVEAISGVEAASPYIDAEGMVRGSQGQISSVRLRGIDPTSVGRVTDLEMDLRLVEGEKTPDLAARFASIDEDSKAPGIVIGGHLAVSMGLEIGDRLLLISPFGGPPTPLGPGPRLKRFTVVGIFQSSFYQYDEAFTYTTLQAARDFRKAGNVVDGIEARTTDHYRSQTVGAAVQEDLGYPFYTKDWKEVFPAFFQALKTERVMMFLLLTMIMVVAAFVIVATLVMMIMEKSSDIAILKAMGAEDALIERVFALEGTLMGLAGTVIGVISGIAVTGQLPWIQDKIEALTGIDTLPASVYQFSELPSKVDPIQVVGVAAIAMILSLGATLLPSRQGARIDPAAGLRHE
ncbi:MAG TPA: FtsX-like permease family protein [Myxococcales bacterium]|nr:FtsX-like permease family protein [Myxococcales bacterium]HIK86730.1 FtsX-like permease family protein [Myxococcales bacterium]